MASDEGERYERSWFAYMNLPKNQDWEFNLLKELSKSGWEAPAIHDQGEKLSCLFHALGYAVELEISLLAWCINRKQNLPRFNIDNFILEYEATARRTLGVDDPGFDRVKVALAVFRRTGVLPRGGTRPICISGHRSYSYLNFEQTARMIYSGHGMVGIFPISPCFSSLGPDDIYEVRRDGIPLADWVEFPSHAVCFVGFGMRSGRPYLVYVNSWGERFGQRGVGRIFFDQIYQLNYGEFRLHSVQVIGGAAPDVPVRRGDSSTWRMSRDPRYPLSWDGGNITVIHTPSTADSISSSTSGSSGALAAPSLD